LSCQKTKSLVDVTKRQAEVNWTTKVSETRRGRVKEGKLEVQEEFGRDVSRNCGRQSRERVNKIGEEERCRFGFGTDLQVQDLGLGTFNAGERLLPSFVTFSHNASGSCAPSVLGESLRICVSARI
jgi:hypothetical protein